MNTRFIYDKDSETIIVKTTNAQFCWKRLPANNSHGWKYTTGSRRRTFPRAVGNVKKTRLDLRDFQYTRAYELPSPGLIYAAHVPTTFPYTFQ